MQEAVRRRIEDFGQLGMLAADTFRSLAFDGIRVRLFLAQIVSIGIASQLVVIVTGAFTGAVFAAQAFQKFQELGLASATGPVVSVAMCRELGPVLAALMVTGRVGSAMAAEIGTMRVGEQIDAMRSMGVDPVGYLVIPRLLAVVISMPILVGEAIWFGVKASELLAVRAFGIPGPWFEEQVILHTGATDVFTGLIKGTVFGILMVFIACHRGLHTEGGAVGVGNATTRAVVDTSLSILIVNFFLSLLLNQWLPGSRFDF